MYSTCIIKILKNSKQLLNELLIKHNIFSTFLQCLSSYLHYSDYNIDYEIELWIKLPSKVILTDYETLRSKAGAVN